MPRIQTDAWLSRCLSEILGGPREDWSVGLLGSALTPTAATDLTALEAAEATFTGYARRPVTRTIGTGGWTAPAPTAPFDATAWPGRTAVAAASTVGTSSWTVGAGGGSIHGLFVVGDDSEAPVVIDTYAVPIPAIEGATMSIPVPLELGGLGGAGSFFVPTVGAVRLLTELLDGSAAREDWSLGLFNSAITPAEVDTAATYTGHEAAFDGYARKTLTRSVSASTWNAPVLQAPSGSPPWSSRGQVAHSQYGSAPLSWTVGATGDTVNGYFIVGATSGTLILAEQFADPRTLHSGDSLSITPVFEVA